LLSANLFDEKAVRVSSFELQFSNLGSHKIDLFHLSLWQFRVPVLNLWDIKFHWVFSFLGNQKLAVLLF